MRIVSIVLSQVALWLCQPQTCMGRPQDTEFINATSSVAAKVIDPFVYSTSQYTFKLAGRPTTHKALEKETLSRLQDGLATAIANAVKRGARINECVPGDNIYIKDIRSGAYLHIEGGKAASALSYHLKWVDLSTFDRALNQYLRRWDQVKRSSLVDIWIYSKAQLLLATGTAERGWPFEPSSNASIPDGGFSQSAN